MSSVSRANQQRMSSESVSVEKWGFFAEILTGLASKRMRDLPSDSTDAQQIPRASPKLFFERDDKKLSIRTKVE